MWTNNDFRIVLTGQCSLLISNYIRNDSVKWQDSKRNLVTLARQAMQHHYANKLFQCYSPLY